MFIHVICLCVLVDLVVVHASTKLPNKCSVTSMEWHALNSKEDVEVIFNPCDFLPEKICGSKKKACVKHKNNILFDGSQFVRGENGTLLLNVTNNSHCSLTLRPECSETLQVKPTLVQIVPCQYEVKLLSLMCPIPECTLRFQNHLIDLRSMKKRHVVQSKNKTFSIDLCGINDDCGTFGASSCDITDENNIIPLSYKNEFFKYNEKLSQVEKHGLFKGNIMGQKIARKFELIIKCDWNTSSSEIRYKEVKPQGKNYKFEMKSKYACVKEPPRCEVTDKFYIYNLTSLHSTTNWSVRNVPVDKKILLNICGSLQPAPRVETDNNCSKSSSQVCMMYNEEFMNMGSIQTELFVANDIVTTTFISGDTCKNDSTNQYSTYIELKCSETEEYPRFVRFDYCRLFLIWNTPAACPINNKESCENISPSFTNTTLQISDNIYNLSTLYKKNSKYSVISESIEYMFNIGGPVVDDDAPCKKNMMVALKNLTDYDVRHRVKSLGHLKKFYENEKGQLVIENDGGDFSAQFQNYYKSTIIFECCDKGNCEEGIKLLSRSEWTFEFVWKTSAVCPRKITSSRCLFKRQLDNEYLYDFTTLKKTDLTVNISGSMYLFDICRNNQSKCDKNGCTYVPVDKSPVTYENKTHLEFMLNGTCAVNHFNKALFELVCDRILNNDHFEFRGLENCTLLFQLKTHKACSEEELFVSLDKSKVKNDFESPKKDPQHTKNEEVDTYPLISDLVHHEDVHGREKVGVDHQQNADSVEKHDIDVMNRSVIKNLENCSVMNHNTGYQFNISSLKLNVSSTECPKMVFNSLHQSVTLLFFSKNPCGKSGTFNYTVIMKCRTGAISPNSTRSGHCLETFITELPEACKLLETTILNNKRISSGKIAGITVGTIAIILFLAGFSILLFRKYRGSKERDSYTMTFYEKMD